MFLTADLEIKNAPFPEKVSSDSYFPIWVLLAFALEHSLLLPSVRLVKNLLSCSGTHSKGLTIFGEGDSFDGHEIQ